jgi:hypothetical protein
MNINKFWIELTEKFYYRLIRVTRLDTSVYYEVEQKESYFGSWKKITLEPNIAKDYYAALNFIDTLRAANEKYLNGFIIKREIVKEKIS